MWGFAKTVVASCDDAFGQGTCVRVSVIGGGIRRRERFSSHHSCDLLLHSVRDGATAWHKWFASGSDCGVAVAQAPAHAGVQVFRA